MAGLAPPVDQHVAGEIAVADTPLALAELPDVGFACQLAADVVGRRRRAGDAEQRVDVGEVRTRHRELHVGAGPLEGIEHRALGLELGGAEGDVEVERIGIVGVAQHGDRAADEADGERLALKLALELQFGLRLVARRAHRRRHRTVELKLALGIAETELAVGDFEAADQRRFEAVVGLDHFLGRRRCGRRLAQGPVQTVVVALLDHDLGLAHDQARQDQIALEQGPGANLEIDLLDLEHVGFLGPLGVGELHAAQVDVRRPAPVDRDVGNGRLAAAERAGMALEATAEIIGRHVEIHRADRNYDQRHQNACCPTEDPKETRHSGGTIPATCSCPHQGSGHK